MEDPKDLNNSREERAMFNSQPPLSSRPEKDYQRMVEYRDWWYRPEDVDEARRRFEEAQAEYRKRLRKDWASSNGGRLCLQLYQDFMAYKKYLEEHRYVDGVEGGKKLEYPEHILFQKVLAEVPEYQKVRRRKPARIWSAKHGGALPAHASRLAPLRGAPRSRQKAVPNAPAHGRARGQEGGPRLDGRP